MLNKSIEVPVYGRIQCFVFRLNKGFSIQSKFLIDMPPCRFENDHAVLVG